jgi:hypothetical protein
MNRQFPSLRDIKFVRRNKTSKKVVALCIRIGDESGAEDMSGPYNISSKGLLTIEENAAANVDSCGRVRKQPIVIQDVSFADGSKWEFKEPGVEKSTERRP